MSKFAVLIPTFNRPRLLERALRSALLLGLDDYQILVIDDGSTISEDFSTGKPLTTKDVVKNFGNKNIIYSRLAQNSGLGAVFEHYRDKLITSKYFMVLNDDDIFIDPEPIHQAIDILDNDESISFVQISLIRRSDNNEINATINLPYPTLSPDMFIKAYVDDDPIKHTTMYGIFRTKLIKQTDALKSLNLRDFGLEDAFGIDTDFLFRMATTGRAAFINKPHVLRRETLGITERYPASFGYCYYQYVIRGLKYMRQNATISMSYKRKFIRYWLGIMVMMYNASIHSDVADEKGEERIRQHLRFPFHIYIIWEMLSHRIFSLQQKNIKEMFYSSWKYAWQNKNSFTRYFFTPRRSKINGNTGVRPFWDKGHKR